MFFGHLYFTSDPPNWPAGPETIVFPSPLITRRTYVFGIFQYEPVLATPYVYI